MTVPLVGVLERREGDLLRQFDLLAGGRRVVGERRQAERDLFRPGPDMFSREVGFRDCLRMEEDRLIEESILMASLNCWSKAKWAMS